MPARATLVYTSCSRSTASYGSVFDELEDVGRTLDLPQQPVRVKALLAGGVFRDLCVEAPGRSVCMAQCGPHMDPREKLVSDTHSYL